MKVTYQIGDYTFEKVTESLENLSGHSSVEIPEDMPFYNETGEFLITDGTDKTFFISHNYIRCTLESDMRVFEILLDMYYEKLERQYQELKKLGGYGKVYEFMGVQFQKVSEETSLYIGSFNEFNLRDYGDELEWIYNNGTYRILGTDQIFVISYGCVSKRENEENKLYNLLVENLEPSEYDEDEGPFGGAFSSWESYWKWRDPTLFK